MLQNTSELFIKKLMITDLTDWLICLNSINITNYKHLLKARYILLATVRRMQTNEHSDSTDLSQGKSIPNTKSDMDEFKNLVGTFLSKDLFLNFREHLIIDEPNC